ncbi:MAG: putative rhomboid protease [Peltula sp. TS41687]|nr:MAG: putative rhomboid protease [Peltula sp. TS41687]
MPSPASALRYNPARLRSYLYRLPLATRAILLFVLIFWLASLLGSRWWDVVRWGALIPDKVTLTSWRDSVYRLSTFPLIHANVIHVLFNVLALVPLLERFEANHGSLVTFALFNGTLSTLPAAMYILLERFVWRGNSATMGASVWICLLLAVEAAKTYKSNPYFSLGPYRIPTWSTPFIVTFLGSFLIPGADLLVNLCGVTVGTLFGLGYLKFLAPPERPLRWVEGKLNLLGRLPHYVSIDQKTYGRYGVLPSSAALEAGIPLTYRGGGGGGGGGAAGTATS